ncbi:hypothetical protein DL771_001069 [Monosporascus sp. 5C6A]|nr:hypothetical protein DL771_001069 [Monosporascus sp. 5C6A]
MTDDANSERPLLTKPETAVTTGSAGDAGENAATAHRDSRALGVPRPGTPAPKPTTPSFQPRAGGGTRASGTFGVASPETVSYPGRPTGFLFGLPPPYAPFVARSAPPSPSIHGQEQSKCVWTERPIPRHCTLSRWDNDDGDEPDDDSGAPAEEPTGYRGTATHSRSKMMATATERTAIEQCMAMISKPRPVD